MTGSLQTKNNIFQMVFSYKDVHGDWRQRSESTGLTVKGNKRRAQEMLATRLAELEKQSVVALTSNKLSFLDFMRMWVSDVIPLEVRPNTLSQYRRVVEAYICKYAPFQGVILQSLTPALLQSYFNEHGKYLSPNTLRKHKANIHKCLDYAVRLELLPYNPADRVVLPKKKKFTGAQVLTPGQLQELCKLFKGDELETAVQITVTYGLRRSEVCGLRWDAVDFDANVIHVRHTAVLCDGEVLYTDNTKTASSRRRLPLTASMRAYLLKVKAAQEATRLLCGKSYDNSGYVCVWEDGRPFSPDFITHHFMRKLKSSDLPQIRFHDLRHSTVNTLRKGGCDAKDIQSWLGHSDVSTTLGVYGHLLDGDMSRMGAVIDTALAG